MKWRYNKFSGEITKLGDINDELLQLETENKPEVAQYVHFLAPILEHVVSLLTFSSLLYVKQLTEGS